MHHVKQTHHFWASQQKLDFEIDSIDSGVFGLLLFSAFTAGILQFLSLQQLDLSWVYDSCALLIVVQSIVGPPLIEVCLIRFDRRFKYRPR